MRGEGRPFAEDRMLADLFAARWLGHGRAVECYLIFVTALYGVVLLIPGAAVHAAPDMIVFRYAEWLALPLLTHTWLAGTGLLGNILGWPGARWVRFAGAMLGGAIWAWLAVRFALAARFASGDFVFSVPAILFSVRIMGMALADLPRPGARGAMGACTPSRR